MARRPQHANASAHNAAEHPDMTDLDQPFREDVIARLTRIEGHVENLEIPSKDHEERLRKVERREAVLAGGISVLALLWAAFVYHIPFIGH